MSDADDTLEAIRVADLVTWDPSDATIARLIRKLRRWSPDTPVSDALIKEFRAQIWTEARKKWRAQRNKRPAPPTILRGYRRRDLLIILEILTESPHAEPLLLLLALATDWTTRGIIEMVARADPNRARFRPPPAIQVARLLAYARSKISSRLDTPWTDHVWAEPANPWCIAGLNGMSMSAAIAFEKRLSEAAIWAPGISTKWDRPEEIVSKMLKSAADYFRARDATDDADEKERLARAHNDNLRRLLALSKIPPPPSPSHRMLDAASLDLEILGRKAVALAGSEIGIKLCEPEPGKPRGILPDPPPPDDVPGPVPASGAPLVPARK
jgi:hypothetical protein